MIGTIIGALIAGVIFGPLGRLVLPGKQNIGIGWTILAGAVGALVGGLAADGLGLTDTARNVDWLRIIIQIVVAAIAVFIVAAWRGNRSKTAT